MKNVLYLCLLFILPVLLQSSVYPSEINNNRGPKMTFKTEVIDYGIIKKDADPLRKFSFKNTGDEPLLITDAKGSCGCTVPVYPTQAIAPGESSEIEVRYDTKRVGVFKKTITVSSNSDESVVLTIMGEVR